MSLVMIIFFSLYLIFYSFHVFAAIQIIARLAAVVDSKPSAYILAEVFLPVSHCFWQEKC